MECIYRVRFGGAASQSKPADRDRDPDGERDSVNGRDRMTKLELGQGSWERGDKRRETKKTEEKRTREKRPDNTASAISRALTSVLESAGASTRGGRAVEERESESEKECTEGNGQKLLHVHEGVRE